MHRVIVPLLVALIAAPTAAALTLSDLEEPQTGVDRVVPLTVTPEEAGEARALIFRNHPNSVFGVVVYDDRGETVYERNGTRGVQTLPALDAGEYRLFIRNEGSVQATDKLLDRELPDRPAIRDVDTTLVGGVDAYAFAPTQDWNVTIGGDVDVEVFDMRRNITRYDAPVTFPARDSTMLILTLRGEEGAPYTIELAAADFEDEPVAENETPAAPLAAVVALVALTALARRVRRT